MKIFTARAMFFLPFIFLMTTLFYSSAPGDPALLATGRKAPGIVLRNINNKLVICKKYLKQSPLLVSFFYTTCKPCLKEIPELEKLNARYKDKVKFVLIATDQEGRDVVEPFIRKMKITIEVLIDKFSDVAGKYNVVKYPSVFLIGKDGKIKYFCNGYQESNITKIEEMIKKGVR